MPNWCQNSLKIIGEEKKLKEFCKKIKKKSFLSSFFPIPKELKNTTAPSKQNLNLLVKYKANDWYEWCKQNWGTKWDFEIDDIENDWDGQRIITFDSAWSPPVEGIQTISKSYPELVFFLDYDEEGVGFKGTARIQNGKVDDKCFDYD